MFTWFGAAASESTTGSPPLQRHPRERRAQVKQYFERIFSWTAWADAQALAALRATPAAVEALPLLAHVLAAEHVWLTRLTGQPTVHPVWPTLDLDQCAVLATQNAHGYQQYLATANEESLARLVRYHTTTGQPFETVPVDMLTQVATHGAYHRGQIARIISQSGGKAISTDFILFARAAGH